MLERVYLSLTCGFYSNCEARQYINQSIFPPLMQFRVERKMQGTPQTAHQSIAGQ